MEQKKATQWSKDILCNKCAGNTGQPHLLPPKINLNTDPRPFTKINLKCINDLHVKCKTIKFLEDNILENLDNLDYGGTF